MSMRWLLLAMLLLLNLFAYRAIFHAVCAWVRDEHRQRRILLVVRVAVFLLNLPLLVFFLRRLDWLLLQASPPLLKIVYYPAAAWLATLLAFFLIAGPVTLLVKLVEGLARLWSSFRPSPPLVPASALASDPAPGYSRRKFLAGGAGLMVPALYGVSAYGAFRALDDLEISPEYPIPVPGLPHSLQGMTIVQLSDLHVGPYIREAELRHLVSLVNGMCPDLVVITGDMIDRTLAALPETVRGLAGIKSELGVFTVLGNHDISSDRYSYTDIHRGGVQITSALDSIGIQTLRNEVIKLGSGQDQLALLGLDWLVADPTQRSFFRYHRDRTVRALEGMATQVEEGMPKILLAHHPDTFADVHPYGISLTLAGHTHGGGQIVMGSVNGTPLGIAALRFRYLSGLYREQGASLYVNRGIGYLGVPIRINCPPEISRFRLLRA